MCPEVPEKMKGAWKGVMLSVKLDVIKHFHGGEPNNNIVCALNLGSENQIFPYKFN